MERPGANEFAALWPLDRRVIFLNHGAFGACPHAVLAQQQRLRQQLEQEPLRFLMRELEPLWNAARCALAEFVGADPAELVFVPNATTGVNTVLRSLSFAPGDELLTTNHTYNACGNALAFVAQRSGAKVVVVDVPFPVQTEDQIVDAVLQGVTPRTRLALLDHITSPTALIFPLPKLIPALSKLGVDTLIDGAHAPGMIPLNLQDLGATYYTGNCHKWMCAPKGAGFLVVQRDRHPQIHPLTLSHGANSPRTDTSRFHLEFDWTGTQDPSPSLCLPAVLAFMDESFPDGGWKAVMERNRTLALQARQLLADTLAIPLPCPDALVGAIAALPLPSAFGPPQLSIQGIDSLQDWLWHVHQIEVPIIPWMQPPQKLLRISAQLYNHLDQYRYLASALQASLLGGSSVAGERREGW